MTDPARDHDAASTAISIEIEMLESFDGEDYDLADHGRRTALLAHRIAKRLELNATDIRHVGLAARLHDIGKIHVPPSLLATPGRLGPIERAAIRRHPELGYRIVSGSVPAEVAEVVLTHHEWWNGQGYPFGLRGSQIPRLTRVVSVADAIDAIVSERVYDPARPVAVACQELVRWAGIQFDPTVVAAAVDVLAEEAVASFSVAV